jgi:hypothetical protein
VGDRRSSGRHTKQYVSRPQSFPAGSFKISIGRLPHPPSTRPDYNRHGEQQSGERGHDRPPVIQVRSISAAVALSTPKLAQETFTLRLHRLVTNKIKHR